MNRTTTLEKKETAQRDWYVVDATDQIVGRLAAQLAHVLMGKNKPTYTPYIDCGDFVVVTNCEKVCFTGKKWQNKLYRHHTKFLGGLVEELAEDIREEHPDRIIYQAVKRMMPKTRLGKQMMTKLRVYAGTEHPHVAQEPKELKIDTRRK